MAYLQRSFHVTGLTPSPKTIKISKHPLTQNQFWWPFLYCRQDIPKTPPPNNYWKYVTVENNRYLYRVSIIDIYILIETVYRSLCTVVCKWTYVAGRSSTGNWDRSYFDKIGLDDLSENDWFAIGKRLWYSIGVIYTSSSISIGDRFVSGPAIISMRKKPSTTNLVK